MCDVAIAIGRLLRPVARLSRGLHLPAGHRGRGWVATGDGGVDPVRRMAFVAGKDAPFEGGTASALSDPGHVPLCLVTRAAYGQPLHEAVR
jgi:hypothetical protein